MLCTPQSHTPFYTFPSSESLPLCSLEFTVDPQNSLHLQSLFYCLICSLYLMKTWLPPKGSGFPANLSDLPFLLPQPFPYWSWFWGRCILLFFIVPFKTVSLSSFPKFPIFESHVIQSYHPVSLIVTLPYILRPIYPIWFLTFSSWLFFSFTQALFSIAISIFQVGHRDTLNSLILEFHRPVILYSVTFIIIKYNTSIISVTYVPL